MVADARKVVNSIFVAIKADLPRWQHIKIRNQDFY